MNLLVTDTQAITELKKTGVTIIASHCHQATLIMNLDTVDSIIGDLDGEDWSLLLVENVPGIQDSILSGSEEYGWSGGTPTPICQVLSIGAK